MKTIAGDKFDSVMTLPPAVWSGYVATAAMKRQGWLTTHKLPWSVLGRERVETLLRWGYALRCLDGRLGRAGEQPRAGIIADGPR